MKTEKLAVALGALMLSLPCAPAALAQCAFGSSSQEYAVPAQAFMPMTPGVTLGYGSDLYLVVSPAVATGWFSAPIHLEAGARITRIECDFHAHVIDEGHVHLFRRLQGPGERGADRGGDHPHALSDRPQRLLADRSQRRPYRSDPGREPARLLRDRRRDGERRDRSAPLPRLPADLESAGLARPRHRNLHRRPDLASHASVRGGAGRGGNHRRLYGNSAIARTRPSRGDRWRCSCASRWGCTSRSRRRVPPGAGAGRRRSPALPRPRPSDTARS